MKKCFLCEEEKPNLKELVLMRNFFKQDPIKETTRETVYVCKECKDELFYGFEEKKDEG